MVGEASQEQSLRVGERTLSDVSSLLIELERILKGRRFYPVDHPAFVEVLARSFRAWSADLKRCGPLELEIRGGSFRATGLSEPLPPGHLDALARQFTYRAIRRVCFEPELDIDAFCTFAEVMATDPDELVEAGGAEAMLAERGAPGISLNEVDYGAVMEKAAAPAPVPAPDAAPEPEAGPAPESLPEIAPGASEETDGSDPLGVLAAMLSAGVEDSEVAEVPDAEEAEERAVDLVGLLRTLDGCDDDDTYVEISETIREEVKTLDPTQFADEGYRAILVLSGHATDPGRSELQSERALEVLANIARGERLDDLIERACDSRFGSPVRATQILLQLGEHAVPRLLELLPDASDSDRRAQMTAVLITMGEQALPPLIDALHGDDPRLARIAARLAGEIQSRGAVTALRRILCGGEAPLEVYTESAKALARIGGNETTDVLVEALGTPDAERAAAVAFCLGSTQAQCALEPLMTVMRRATRQGEIGLARDTIRALGRLGRHEAAPELAAILRRRGFFGRGKLRELKVAAAGALARLPGQEARQALEQAADTRDPELRRAARSALARRRDERDAAAEYAAPARASEEAAALEGAA